MKGAPSFEELKKRKEILVEVIRNYVKRRTALPSRAVDLVVLKIRHQIQNAQHNGYFVNFCCDLCYSELYCENPLLPKELICPGCGWNSSQIPDTTTG